MDPDNRSVACAGRSLAILAAALRHEQRRSGQAVADRTAQAPAVENRTGVDHQARFSTCSFRISVIAFAGLRPFGQTLAQFMIVWQR
jgi:hypothetical protein